MESGEAGKEYLKETYIDATIHVRGVKPDKVLDAFVNPDVVNNWFTIGASFKGRVGGELRWKWENYPEVICEITEWEPGKVLAFR